MIHAVKTEGNMYVSTMFGKNIFIFPPLFKYIFISSVRFSLFLRVVLPNEFRTLKCPTAHQVTKMLYCIEFLRDLGKLS